jgi:hypothetical protein
LKNDVLEKALEGTWKNKEKFYEDTKDLSMVEIIKKIEEKYKVRGTTYNRTVTASPLKRFGVQFVWLERFVANLLAIL